MISRTHEIMKQVIGKDANLEKFGRILNIIKWGRDGITIRGGSETCQGDIESLELEGS